MGPQGGSGWGQGSPGEAAERTRCFRLNLIVAAERAGQLGRGTVSEAIAHRGRPLMGRTARPGGKPWDPSSFSAPRPSEGSIVESKSTLGLSTCSIRIRYRCGVPTAANCTTSRSDSVTHRMSRALMIFSHAGSAVQWPNRRNTVGSAAISELAGHESFRAWPWIGWPAASDVGLAFQRTATGASQPLSRLACTASAARFMYPSILCLAAAGYSKATWCHRSPAQASTAFR